MRSNPVVSRILRVILLVLVSLTWLILWSCCASNLPGKRCHIMSLVFSYSMFDFTSGTGEIILIFIYHAILIGSLLIFVDLRSWLRVGFHSTCWESLHLAMVLDNLTIFRMTKLDVGWLRPLPSSWTLCWTLVSQWYLGNRLCLPLDSVKFRMLIFIPI